MGELCAEEIYLLISLHKRPLSKKAVLHPQNGFFINTNHKDQLIEKNIGSNSANSGALQSIDYLYNVRGWLTNINNVALNGGSGGATNSIFTPQSTGSSPIQNLAITPFINKAVQDAVRPYRAANANELPPLGDNNSDLFSQVITYGNPAAATGATPQYNGNISSTTWQVAGRDKQAYGFKYDELDRLVEANYFDIVDQYSSPYTSVYSTDNKFKEKVSYDYRGNITSLERYGLNEGTWTTADGYVAGTYGMIDNLEYAYGDSNRVKKVTDVSLANKGFKYRNNGGTRDYDYDKNGNLVADRNKYITEIQYNYLNLPMLIRFDKPLDRFNGSGTIQFVYDATGVKLKKIITYHPDANRPTETYDYINGVEYKNDVLQRIAHTEGSVSRNENGAYEHQYVLRDHLGNVRVTFRDGTNLGEPYMDWETWEYVDPNANNVGYNDGIVSSTDIMQVNHYYPFGLNMEGNWQGGASGTNKYGYNEKEWNDDFGLGWNDYGARFYDPALARWNSVDLLTEEQTNWSPYHYVYCNPVLHNDPSGMIGNAFTTNVVNKVTGEKYAINDGYDFDFNVNESEFKEIKDKGKIVGTSSYGRWVKEATASFLEKFLSIFERNTEKLTTEMAESLDEGLLGGAGNDAINGQYTKAALMVLLSRFKLTGLAKFGDLLKISTKLKSAPKGKGQYAIVGSSIKDIFQELQKSGFKIAERIKDIGVKLKNSTTGEEIIIRKSQQGGYKTFDTISGQVNGVQTDIRVDIRN